MTKAKIAGVTFETDDAQLFEVARHCGPGFAARIAKKEGKVWRIVNE